MKKLAIAAFLLAVPALAQTREDFALLDATGNPSASNSGGAW